VLIYAHIKHCILKRTLKRNRPSKKGYGRKRADFQYVFYFFVFNQVYIDSILKRKRLLLNSKSDYFYTIS
jgi:hypothetical protein